MTFSDLFTLNQNVSFNSQMPFYLNAFLDTQETIWKNTAFANRAGLLAFYQAHNIFLNENASTESDRRELLFNYCLPFMAADSTQDALYKAIPALSTNNQFVARSLREICTLYSNEPTRTIEGAGADDMLELLENSLFNKAMQTAHKSAKLAYKCVVRPYFVNGELDFEIVTSDNYNFSDDYKNLYIHKEIDLDGKVQDVIVRWNAEEFTVSTIGGKDITAEYLQEANPDGVLENRNPYGFIPYLELKLNPTFSTESNTLWALVKAQLDYNRLTLLEENNVIYNGFSMFVVTNFDLPQNISFSAGKTIEMNNISDDTGDVLPSIETISFDSQYNDISDLKINNIKTALRNMGLPSSMVDDTANLQSGIAMQIERIPLAEYRKDDIAILKKFDKAMINMIALIYNTDINQKFGELKISIEYIENQYPSDPKQDFELATEKFERGLISAETYLQTVSTIDDIDSNEQAVEVIRENLTILKQIKELQNARATTNVGSDIGTGTTTNTDSGEPTTDADTAGTES